MKKTSLFLIVLLIAFAGCKKAKVEQGPIDNKLILAYIQANHLTAKSTADGLYYVVNNPGDATRPINTSTVYVKYRGYLMNGTVLGKQFDSSFESSDQAASFTITGVIPGFGEGLKLFGKGGKGLLIIPSTLGYKDVDQHDNTGAVTIPANSILIFDIELVAFQ